MWVGLRIPETDRVVSPNDGQVKVETFNLNKVIVTVEVYQVGRVYYVITFYSAFTQVDAKLHSPTKKTEAVSVFETSEYTYYPT
jgi:hypothetical protein